MRNKYRSYTIGKMKIFFIQYMFIGEKQESTFILLLLYYMLENKIKSDISHWLGYPDTCCSGIIHARHDRENLFLNAYQGWKKNKTKTTISWWPAWKKVIRSDSYLTCSWTSVCCFFKWKVSQKIFNQQQFYQKINFWSHFILYRITCI